MKAILAGGGTGGHVIPAIAIAQELQRRYQAEVLFIGTARGLENRLVPEAGFPLQFVKVGALNRVSLATRVKTLLDLPRAIFAAGRLLNEFQPDVVIGVGGYASGPAMLAAIRRRISTLAFEPNVVPGFANRIVEQHSAQTPTSKSACEWRQAWPDPKHIRPHRSQRRVGIHSAIAPPQRSREGDPTRFSPESPN